MFLAGMGVNERERERMFRILNILNKKGYGNFIVGWMHLCARG